jgi:hypothetical protein
MGKRKPSNHDGKFLMKKAEASRTLIKLPPWLPPSRTLVPALPKDYSPAASVSLMWESVRQCELRGLSLNSTRTK